MSIGYRLTLWLLFRAIDQNKKDGDMYILRESIADIKYIKLKNGFECNLGKTCTSELFKNVQKCTSPKDECNSCVFENFMSACFPPNFMRNHTIT